VTPAQTAEEFWKEYGAQPKPAGRSEAVKRLDAK
jgi:hypothetical protein